MRFSRTTTLHLILLTLVAGVIFFFKLGDAPLWDRDEPRNAGCAAEMIAANDWVVPIFNAELRTHKPVLLYWLMMSSYAFFGVNEFGARFFSALLGIGCVLLTYGMGRRLFSASVGFWSGLILCSTIMFGVAARAATPDSLLIFCGTLAISLFVLFAFDPRRESYEQTGRFPKQVWQAALIYAAMGLGVLAKGPVGLVVPTAVIGMYLLIIRLEPRSIKGNAGDHRQTFRSRSSVQAGALLEDLLCDATDCGDRGCRPDRSAVVHLGCHSNQRRLDDRVLLDAQHQPRDTEHGRPLRAADLVLRRRNSRWLLSVVDHDDSDRLVLAQKNDFDIG